MKFRSLRSLRSTLGTVALLLALAVSLPFSALAQTFRGGINGTVTDQSGAVVPGASSSMQLKRQPTSLTRQLVLPAVNFHFRICLSAVTPSPS